MARTESGTWTSSDNDGNKYFMPANQETCTVMTPDGYEGFGWTPEEALSNVEKLLEMMQPEVAGRYHSNEIQNERWRKFYAERFGTIPENIFYWWELTRKLQAAAQKDFSDLLMFDCVYYVSEKQIMSRGIKAHQDDTKETPS